MIVGNAYQKFETSWTDLVTDKHNLADILTKQKLDGSSSTKMSSC